MVLLYLELIVSTRFDLTHLLYFKCRFVIKENKKETFWAKTMCVLKFVPECTTNDIGHNCNLFLYGLVRVYILSVSIINHHDA